MELTDFYGLSMNPFAKDAIREEDCFESTDIRMTLNRMNYLKDVRGIGVFTASSGMGKSFCLRCFSHSLNKSLFDMKYICLTTVSVGDFYKLLCDALGLEAKGGKTAMFRDIKDRIFYLYQEKKQPLIITIDAYFGRTEHRFL